MPGSCLYLSTLAQTPQIFKNEKKSSKSSFTRIILNCTLCLLHALKTDLKNLSSHEKSLYKIVHQFYRFFNVIYAIHHILDSSLSMRDWKTDFILFHLKKTDIMHTIAQNFMYTTFKQIFYQV